MGAVRASLLSFPHWVPNVKPVISTPHSCHLLIVSSYQLSPWTSGLLWQEELFYLWRRVATTTSSHSKAVNIVAYICATPVTAGQGLQLKRPCLA